MKDEHGNVLGQISFLTPQNTTILAAAGPPPPPPRADAHYGIEFADIAKFYKLGVCGLEYLKSALGAEASPARDGGRLRLRWSCSLEKSFSD